MNCPCDEIVFPSPRVIPAGLSRLPRQIGTFPEFRAAMLSTIGAKPALKDWRARRSDDFGVMLLEMWSYVCDCIAFYDEIIANECYLRTAQLRPSLRKLVALMGYLPRPAVASRVDLAILAEGRQYVTLPHGTTFRSGAFPGSPPQVFELDAASRVHPFTNQWTLARTRPSTLEPGPTFQASRDTFLLDPRSVAIKSGQLLLVRDLSDANMSNTRMRKVAMVEDFAALDGAVYKELRLPQSLPIDGRISLANLQLTTPSLTGTIWQQPLTIGGATVVGNLLQGTYSSTGLIDGQSVSYVIFDSLHRQIQVGDALILDRSGDFRWFTVAALGETFVNLPAPGNTTITGGITVTPPAPMVQVTWVQLDRSFNDALRRETGITWGSPDAANIKVRFGFRTAGIPVVPADVTLQPGDPLNLIPPVESPQDGKAPSQFLLQDKDSIGAEITGAVNFVARTLIPSNPLARPLMASVAVYGNVVTASRGERVAGEVLGSGDASIPNQTFKLKKSPLTYFSAPDGVTSTLRVYVNGLQWTEVPSFFGVASQAQVFVVRQNDDGDSFVVGGDGIRGSRFPSGNNNIIAYYRFGAGKASPPAGSIHQTAKPVKGIVSVRNPVAASGGDDAEPATGLRTYAPRSALLLGRAISIPDMEAAAASVSGVRSVRAEWSWNQLRQRPLVQIWYIGAATVATDIVKKLRGLSDTVTPIGVERAMPVIGTLSLSIEIDPKRIEADVLTAVRASLMNPDTGPLAPERIGIGLPLFRSEIFETVMTVPGAEAVTGLFWNGVPFDPFGLPPGAGKYFDLETGTLLLNGKASINA